MTIIGLLTNPSCRHLEFFPNPQVLLQTYSSKDPKLILAVPASLSHGPSRLLFADFAAVPDNVILLTGRGEEGTFGRMLFERWNNSQRAEDKWDKGKLGSSVMLDGSLELRVGYWFHTVACPVYTDVLYVQLNSKVPLTGVELEIFQQRQRLAREKAAVAQAALVRNQQLLEADEGADSSDSDSDAEDEEDVERALGLDTEMTRADGADWGRGMDTDDSGRQMLSFDIYLKGNVSRATSFFKKSTGKENQRFRMFPYVEKKRRVDEYGEMIDVAMWVRRGKIMEEEAEDEEAKERKRQEEEAKVCIFISLLSPRISSLMLGVCVHSFRRSLRRYHQNMFQPLSKCSLHVACFSSTSRASTMVGQQRRSFQKLHPENW
jgi:cleavage and polyadenylation specificity factor subunit 2